MMTLRTLTHGIDTKATGRSFAYLNEQPVI
jgi:hypothetical protein